MARRFFFFSPNALRQRREACGLTQVALSCALGVSQPNVVSNWETGKHQPELGTFFLIVEVLGCEIEDLLISLDTDDEAPEGTS
ncbi:MAG: helix-turn-helix transcriptional regulator [Thermoleophilaceae bacterium]